MNFKFNSFILYTEYGQIPSLMSIFTINLVRVKIKFEIIFKSVPADRRRAEILQHLREQLEKNKILYSKDQIELSTTVGHGRNQLMSY